MIKIIKIIIENFYITFINALKSRILFAKNILNDI